MSRQRIRYASLCVLVFLLVLSVRIVGAEPCTDYFRHFHWIARASISGGPFVNLAVRGSHAFVTDQSFGLRVLNIEDPIHPVLETSLPLPGGPWDIALTGDLACITVFDQGLVIVDISDPSQPSLVGSLYLPSTIGLAVKGEYAFVTDFSTQSVYVISLKDPTNPQIIGEMRTPSWPWDVAIVGGQLLVTATNTFVVADISDPTNPHRIGSVGIPSAMYDLAVDGSRAYVGAASFFFVVDFADPEHPALVGDLDLGSMNWTVKARGGYAFVGREDDGMSVIDVHDPTNPIEVSHFHFDMSEWIWGLEFVGNLMYAIDYWNGLHILDVTGPAAVQPIGVLETPDPWVQGITYSRPYAYVADGAGEFLVVDLSVPESPRLAAQAAMNGAARDVAYHAGYAYLAGPGLEIFDVSDPEDPAVVAAMPEVGSTSHIGIQGGRAYVLGAMGLSVIDVSTPAQPTLEGRLPGQWTDMVLRPALVYLAAGSHVDVVDISSPDNPSLLYSAPVDVSVEYIAGGFGALYAGGEQRDIAVLDLADPVHPQLAGHVPILWDAVSDLTVHGECLWVTEQTSPLLLYDLSHPLSPQPKGLVNLGDFGAYAITVAVGDRFALVGCMGLQVLPCHIPIKPFGTQRGSDPPLPSQSGLLIASGPAIDLGSVAPPRTDEPILIVEASGRVVRRLDCQMDSRDTAPCSWDLRNGQGDRVRPGVYFVRSGGQGEIVKKVLVLP